MQSSSFDTHTIEEFVTGNTSPELTHQIESLISSNPTFKSEIELQKSIIDGLKESREDELKARLSGLKPFPDFTKIIQYTSAGIAAATVVSAALYYTFIKSEDYTFAKVDHQLQHSSAYTEYNNHLEQATASINDVVVLPQAIQHTPKSQYLPKKVAIQEQLSEPINDNSTLNPESLNTQDDILEVVEAQAEEPVFIPSPSNPLVKEVDDEVAISYSNEQTTAKNFDRSQTIAQTISEPNVSVIVDYADDKFAYIFDGESLTLIGEFDKNYPYTVYELNFKKKMFFIEYKEVYYELKQTASLRLFKKLTNKAIIQKLENLNK